MLEQYKKVFLLHDLGIDFILSHYNAQNHFELVKIRFEWSELEPFLKIRF